LFVTDERVRFSIGPVPADMARAWLDNSARLLQAVRSNPSKVSIPVHEHALELCAAVVDVWASAAERVILFEWSSDTTVDQLLVLAKQWVAIGQLPDAELAAIGCTWAPEWTRPFADALVTGVVAALERVPRGAEDVLARLRAENAAVLR
jgi:hypothetical protein